MFGYYFNGLGWYFVGAITVSSIITSLLYFYTYAETGKKPTKEQSLTSISTSIVIFLIFPLILETAGNEKLKELLKKDSPGYADIYSYLHIFSLFCIFSLGGMSVIEKIYKTITGNEFDKKALILKTATDVSEQLLKHRQSEIMHIQSSAEKDVDDKAKDEEIDFLKYALGNKLSLSVVKSKFPLINYIKLEQEGLIKLIFDVEEMDYMYEVTNQGQDFIGTNL